MTNHTASVPTRKPARATAQQKAKQPITPESVAYTVKQLLRSIDEHLDNADVANDGEPFAERMIRYTKDWALTEVYEKLNLDAVCDKTAVAALEPLNDLQAFIKAVGELTESKECRERMVIAFDLVDQTYALLDQFEGFWPPEPQHVSAQAAKETQQETIPADMPLNTQLANLLERIATLANVADAFVSHIPVSSDSSLWESQAHYLRGQVNQLGWMADFGFEQATGGHQVRGGAQEWLLPSGCWTSTREGSAR